MTVKFLGQCVWPELTRAARRNQGLSAVAVAYFGSGASRVLPLAEGDVLVVDASEHAVRAGQTCPTDLARLAKRGVSVFSVPNLHAKVFVLGRAAFVGSANVSSTSANHLVEAMLKTSDPGAVRTARRFVRGLCLHELTPELLIRLESIYRPPIVPGRVGRKATRTGKSNRPTLPRVVLAQLSPEDWTAEEQGINDSAVAAAKVRMQHPRTNEFTSFRIAGQCKYRRGDVVVQVLDEGGGRVMIEPPGNVLHVRTRRTASRVVSFIYLELPKRRRRSIRAVARSLGHGALKLLERDIIVRDPAIAQRLLNLWNR